MGLIRFIRNLKYLFKYNLKQINRDIQIDKYEVRKISNRMERALPPVLSYVDYLYKRDNTLKKPYIASWDETLDELCSTKKSFIRFGDGEFVILAGGGIDFQKADARLQKRFIEILDSEDDRYMIGLTEALWYRVRPIRRGWDWEMSEYAYARVAAESHLLRDKYYNAEVTLLYGLTAYKHIYAPRTTGWYDKWRSIWDGRDVAVVCGDRVFSKIKCNIFDNAKRVQYVFTPSEHAFDDYNTIYNKIKTFDKKTIVCLIVGPTAKVLAYDLTVKEGFRCLDIGHLAKDYDCWKRCLSDDHEIVRTFFSPD